jgi:hypothetical protein
MPGTVAVEVYGADMVAQELLNAGDRAADMMPLWPRIVEALEEIEQDQYESQGRRGPRGPWRDNSQKWSWFKFQHNMSLEVMKATEATFEALTGTTSDSVRDMTPYSLAFGADLPQFAYQQDPPLDAEYPIRYPIDLTSEDVLWITNSIEKFITGAFARSGGMMGSADVWYNAKAKRWQSRSTGKFVKAPRR